METVDFLCNMHRLKEIGYSNRQEDALEALFPILADRREFDCPKDIECGRDRIDGLIIHLMDDHEWSRDEIADWIDLVDGGTIRGYEPPPPIAKLLDALNLVKGLKVLFD